MPSGDDMKKQPILFLAGALVLGGLAIWSLWDLVAWTVPGLLLAGFALLTISVVISV
jgi:hypothetical protein